MAPEPYTLTKDEAGNWRVTLDERTICSPFADREDAEELLVALNEAYQLGATSTAKTLAEEIFRSE